MEKATPSKGNQLCTHINRQVFAKNMCLYCYHRYADNKRAFNCQHKDMPHYAKGLCMKCYFQMKNKQKWEKKKAEKVKLLEQ